MEREILFRGKMIDNGEWIEGFFVQQKEKFYICSNLYQIMDGYSSKNGQHYGFGDFYEVDPETVCQYTGLTDKNGKKIYEGDILKRILLPTKRIENVFRVKFVPVKSCFSAIDLNGSDVTFISDYINSNYEIEVIGNIFDNPELLKGA